MDTKNLTPEQLIYNLNIAGRYPNPDLINAIYEQRSKTEPLLLSLFAESFDDDWPSDNDPRWHRFTHAGAFMIAWQNLDALSIFARLYMDDDKQDWLVNRNNNRPAKYGSHAPLVNRKSDEMLPVLVVVAKSTRSVMVGREYDNQ